MRLNSLIGVLFLAILKMSSQTITIEHGCISNKQKEILRTYRRYYGLFLIIKNIRKIRLNILQSKLMIFQFIKL